MIAKVLKHCTTLHYISKVFCNLHCVEELKTVVHKFPACTQPKHHQISTAPWTLYCIVSIIRRQYAQICCSRGAHSENQKMTVCHYGFMEKLCWFPCTVSKSTMQDSPTCNNGARPTYAAHMDPPMYCCPEHPVPIQAYIKQKCNPIPAVHPAKKPPHKVYLIMILYNYSFNFVIDLCV